MDTELIPELNLLLSPKEAVKEFIRIPMETTYDLEIEKGRHEYMLQRMRIELSKMRSIVKMKLRRTVKPFKMMFIECKDHSDPDKFGKFEIMTLKKTINPDDVTAEVHNVFKDIML